MPISAYKIKNRMKNGFCNIWTVWDCLSRGGSLVSSHAPETHANGHELTEIKEKSLIKWLLDADNRGFSVRLDFLYQIARFYLRTPTATLGQLGI